MTQKHTIRDADNSGNVAEHLLECYRDTVGPIRICAPVVRGDLQHEQELAVFDYWFDLPKHEGVAQTSTVDPFLIRSALGNVMLLDVINGGQRFYYSLYGSKIADASGFDMTQKYLDQLPSGSAIQSFFFGCYQKLVENRTSLLTEHQAPDNVMIGSWRRLQLPLGRGREVKRILVCNLPMHMDGGLK